MLWVGSLVQLPTQGHLRLRLGSETQRAYFLPLQHILIPARRFVSEPTCLNMTCKVPLCIRFGLSGTACEFMSVKCVVTFQLHFHFHRKFTISARKRHSLFKINLQQMSNTTFLGLFSEVQPTNLHGYVQAKKLYGQVLDVDKRVWLSLEKKSW